MLDMELDSYMAAKSGGGVRGHPTADGAGTLIVPAAPLRPRMSAADWTLYFSTRMQDGN